MTPARHISFAILLLSCLAGCTEYYPLVANGYGSTAQVSALDNEGHGNIRPLEPRNCLLAFVSMPDLATLEINVYREGEGLVTYKSAALARTLGGQDFSKGIFVVDPSGIRFEKGYECEDEVR